MKYDSVSKKNSRQAKKNRSRQTKRSKRNRLVKNPKK